MLISAAIIVKNEEGIMQRCLDCVSMFADEIVVVDTGSTDKTKEIAAAHPKVRLFDSDHFGSWTHYSEFSFSVAKNEAIKRCEGKWIIWWDADDFTDEENAARIREIAERTEEVCLFTFTMKYGPLTFEHCRMFRSGNGILFDEAHSVHEFLNTLGFPNHARRDVLLNHLPGKKSVPSGKRNIAIMEKDYYDRGMDDQRTLFYLANGYREAGRFEESVEFYKKYLEKSGWWEERFFARYFMAQALIRMEDFGQARQEALRACAEDFRFAEAYCLLGDLAVKEGDYKRAQSWFQMACDTPFPKNAKLFVAQPLYGPYPSSRIRDCHKALVGNEAEPGEVKKIEPGKKMGTFSLPDDEALMAASVLAAIATHSSGVFKVESGNEEVGKLIELCDGLERAGDEDVALSLILPPKLNGRSREEWYGRAAGHVLDNWEPIVNEARRLADEVRSS
jgi:glycosyltransferase involved in cell wall biosynthesis